MRQGGAAKPSPAQMERLLLGLPYDPVQPMLVITPMGQEIGWFPSRKILDIWIGLVTLPAETEFFTFLFSPSGSRLSGHSITSNSASSLFRPRHLL